jgi:hypothetical protein
VINAGRPGGVIGLVVLWPERGQPEFPGDEPVGCREIFRNEQLIAHPAILTRLRRQTLRHTGGRDQILASATTKTSWWQVNDAGGTSSTGLRARLCHALVRLSRRRLNPRLFAVAALIT